MKKTGPFQRQTLYEQSKPLNKVRPMEQKNLPKFNYKEAAEILHVKEITLRMWISQGKI